MPHSLRLRKRPTYADRAQKLPTRMGWSETNWGYTYGAEKDEKENYTPLSTFRLIPVAFIEGQGQNSKQPGGGVEILVKMSIISPST